MFYYEKLESSRWTISLNESAIQNQTYGELKTIGLNG